MTAYRTFSIAGAAVAAACTLVLTVAPAGAQTADQSNTRGMPMVVSDVMAPGDPGFWDPAVDGTRILTPVEPGVRVACATGFDPVISCNTLDMRGVTSPQRQLGFVDVPTLGGPLRMWFDHPRWGDGSTAAVNQQIIGWWMERR